MDNRVFYNPWQYECYHTTSMNGTSISLLAPKTAQHWGRTHQMNLRDATEGCVLKFLKQPCMSTRWLILIRWPGKADGRSDTQACNARPQPGSKSLAGGIYLTLLF